MESFCSQCGNKTGAGIKFCSSCGTPVKRTVAVSNKEESEEDVCQVSEGVTKDYDIAANQIASTGYEFIERSFFANSFGKVIVKVSFEGKQVLIRRTKKIFLFKPEEELKLNKDIAQIHSVYLEKKFNLLTISIIAAILIISVLKGEVTWKVSWIACIFIWGIYKKTICIKMKDGSDIRIKNITSVTQVEALFNKFTEINPAIVRIIW